METKEISDVVTRVRNWPVPMRIALARRILETLEDNPKATEAPTLPRGPSAAEVAALLRNDKPAPDDNTVRQWIDEHRMAKYGK